MGRLSLFTLKQGLVPVGDFYWKLVVDEVNLEIKLLEKCIILKSRI